MPESAEYEPVTERVQAAGPGLVALLAEAQATWNRRAQASGDRLPQPGWRNFEDAFPTFYQFTNRPR